VNKTQLLQGTLDLLILRILELGPNHGWGISSRLQQMSKDALKTSQGSLYPALHRLEMRGDVTSEMTASENNRRARVYTARGSLALDVVAELLGDLGVRSACGGRGREVLRQHASSPNGSHNCGARRLKRHGVRPSASWAD